MIFYLKNNQYGSIIYEDNLNVQTNVTSNYFIKQMCIKYLFTFESYISSVKKILNIKELIPIYFDEKNIFFPICNIKKYENIWINSKAINKVYLENKQVKVHFLNDSYLELKISFNLYKVQIEKIRLIENYKSALLSQ